MANEEPVSPTPEEPLSRQMGDPSGPPQAVDAKDPVLRTIGSLGIGLVIAGGVLLPAMLSTGHTAGATRSAKVRWEHRQQQLEKTHATIEGKSHE
jgi:hypothetical protein